MTDNDAIIKANALARCLSYNERVRRFFREVRMTNPLVSTEHENPKSILGAQEPSTHRATPWYVGEMNDHGIRVAPVADPRNAVAYAFDEDDAAFIVRACNSHDAFKRLLERASKSIQDWCDSRDYMPDEDAELLAEIRAALRAVAPSQANGEGEK